MFKRLLDAFKNTSGSAGKAHQTSQLLEIYELLFCDKPELFEPKEPGSTVGWKKALYGESSPESVRAISDDSTQESRVRLLAFRWLASYGFKLSSKEILGVVIEVGLEQGNDTLAAYADGSVR